MALGIKKGDHIAVWAYNVPEWVYLQFASAKIGAILVTVNTYYKSHELEYLLKQSDATSLFLVDEFKGVNYLDILKSIIPNFKFFRLREKLWKYFIEVWRVYYHFKKLVKEGKK